MTIGAIGILCLEEYSEKEPVNDRFEQIMSSMIKISESLCGKKAAVKLCETESLHYIISA